MGLNERSLTRLYVRKKEGDKGKEHTLREEEEEEEENEKGKALFFCTRHPLS